MSETDFWANFEAQSSQAGGAYYTRDGDAYYMAKSILGEDGVKALDNSFA
jgi:hypothetical protein